MSKTCKYCGERSYKEYCFRHKPKKSIQIYKKLKPRSLKQIDYDVWKEAVARPYLINKFGNVCVCCGVDFGNRKLDIEHIKGKGPRPELKQDLKNLQLMCRFPCHRNKTDNKECLHGDYK